jgi:dTDP-L-rhamnose 4-epimerase
MRILITGGAGFIGTHLARRLLQEGCAVTVFDNFSPQIHGGCGTIPPDLRDHVQLITGDVRDEGAFHRALSGQDVVAHFAAETGTGQSMYEVARYEEVNVRGTAILMDYLVNQKSHRIGRVVTASSRAIYGEGKHRCPHDGIVYPGARTAADMAVGQFEPRCPRCGARTISEATDEASLIHPTSFYGLTKQMQEQMTLLFAGALGIHGFALRYQNVYGPGQSLKNPYTGILALFSNLARGNEPIAVFEDGLESRDFVYIDDVVEATWRCLQPDIAGVHAINIGSGVRTTVADVARMVVAFFDSLSEVKVNGAFRVGDIRHNVADLALARSVLGFAPRWQFADGLKQFLAWTHTQSVDTHGYRESLTEMADRG